MNLPNVTQAQIDAMNKIASEKYKIEEMKESNEPMQMHEDQVQDESQQVYEDSEQLQDQESKIEETAYASQETSQKFGQSHKENNFKVMRERLEKAERERDEMMQYIMQSKQSSSNKEYKQEHHEVDPIDQLMLDDESLVEGKHLKELVKEVKNLRNTVKSYEQKYQKTSQDTLEVRLQSQFPDFNKVVTQENLSQLRQMNPDLAEAILSNKDQYKQAKLAYDMVKQLGIYTEDTFEKERVIAQRNSSKPRPLSSISPTQSSSPLSKVNAFAEGAPLTKELRQAHYEEMIQAMKGR